MAQTVKFDGCNKTYGPPAGVTEEQCATIGVFTNGACIVSAWKLTPEELAEINRTGLVWQSIWSNGLPPSFIGSETVTHALVADFGAVWPLSKQPTDDLEKRIADLANRFWTVKPREIQDMGITREEFYAQEIKNLLR